jgi:hypothetical protein
LGSKRTPRPICFKHFARLELDKAYQALGKSAFVLIDAGELTQTRFDENAERIRELKAQLATKSAS